MSLQSKLYQIGIAFASVVTNSHHYWRPVTEAPCLIWAETGEADSFHGNNRKAEQSIAGTCDYYTKTEFDPLIEAIQAKLDDLGLAWRLAAVDYEDETNMIHYSWEWEVITNGEVPNWDGD